MWIRSPVPLICCGETQLKVVLLLWCNKPSWCHKPEPDPYSLLWCFLSFKITLEHYTCCVCVNHLKLLQIIIRSPVSKQRLGSAWWYLGSVQIFQSLDGWIVLILSLNSFPTPAKRNRSAQFSDRQVGDNAAVPSQYHPPHAKFADICELEHGAAAGKKGWYSWDVLPLAVTNDWN